MTETRFQKAARAARKRQSREAKLKRRGEGIAGGRWRSGPHKDRRREAKEGYERDDLGENPDQ